MKFGKEIHEIFLFYTPKSMDVYFQYLKNKIKKAVGVTTLLVKGDDLPNIHSESYMGDMKLFKVHPNIKDQETEELENEFTNASTNVERVVDLDKQSKIKNFSKVNRTKQANKSCIINKKAS